MNCQVRGNAGNDKKWLQSTGYIFLIAICEKKNHPLAAIFYSDYKILPNNICQKGYMQILIHLFSKTEDRGPRKTTKLPHVSTSGDKSVL